MIDRPFRIVLAKLGLDDHLRSLYVLSYAFRDAGMEVIYLGPYQTPENVVATAQIEDADAIGLSFHTVSYFGWLEETMNRLREQCLYDRISVFVGGTIPPADKPYLEQAGVRGVFLPGDSLEYIISEIEKVLSGTRS